MNYILFVTGPTASGKTDFSIKLAERLSMKFGVQAEIINADTGQFYTKLSIGTAKPDWRALSIKHHLFDIVDTPKNFNVVAYRDLLMKTARSIQTQGKLAIVVGGSLFYIRSLFWPPKEELGAITRSDVTGSYERLQQVDPERANAINPGDTYRIQRALAIWDATGKKPSEYEPEFKPNFHSRIVFIDLPRELIYERINERTKQMIDHKNGGWIEEVERMQGTPWEDFLKEKKLIGYPDILSWLESGGDKTVLTALIQQKTRKYAKRQVTFWKKFRTILDVCAKKSSYLCRTGAVDRTDDVVVEDIVMLVEKDLDFVRKTKGET
ncbi:tRNA (adenosine(37)-N6)-dimethylallyltransferase MiaA [Candidatus Dependentiae bacterium]|nr:tRNA (adenosine(37)-N6)-dimethylallyltransferase MiaA [Candidatus Dependentiae bacterium]